MPGKKVRMSDIRLPTLQLFHEQVMYSAYLQHIPDKESPGHCCPGLSFPFSLPFVRWAMRAGLDSYYC
jgi:hypothetical protein